MSMEAVCNDTTESPGNEGVTFVSECGGGVHDLECGEDTPIPVGEEEHSPSLDQPHTTMTPPSVEEGTESYQSLLSNCKELQRERDQLTKDLDTLRRVQEEKERSFQEVTNKLEKKVVSRQEEFECLSDELASARESAGRREAELEGRMDQVTCLYEQVTKEKDDVIGKLGLLENERRKLINELTTAEQKVREATKESEKQSTGLKKHKTEVNKLQTSLEKSESRCGEQSRELTKLKEEASSLNIKVKWAQNKLKAETDGHKETKSQLQLSTKRLKEAREEGEQIRADLKKMIQQYQDSEEMRSNSLDIKLKKTEKELKQHEQEIADQQELHELTVKELELSKASHKIAQQEVQQHKTKLSELNNRISEQAVEIEDMKNTLTKLKDEQKRLSTEKTELEKHSQNMEGERTKLTQLREAFTSLQKSHQHLEREIARRTERETELLTFTEKLSSANAEMQAERSEWETKVSSLALDRQELSVGLTESRERAREAEERLTKTQEDGQQEIERLTNQLHNKSKAVEELSMALEDEREAVKATRKKNTSNIRDLQRQLQHSKRRIDQLESSLQAERESPATLPITEGSRTSSQNSLDGVVTSNPSNRPVGSNAVMATLVPMSNNSIQHSTVPLSDEERAAASPSPELLFQSMDQEKMFLVEKLCKIKRELAKQEEKLEFFEEHTLQLTEDIQRKSKIIQSFIMREQSGALAPAAYDEHKLRHSRKGGVMATVFTGGKGSKVSRTHPEMTYDLSLEMNRKMQSVLEDTLLKNITLKDSIDTLGKEIQRLSAQLQSYETSRR